MGRLFALYINELIKISRKVSIIIILAVMVVAVAGFGGIYKMMDRGNMTTVTYTGNTESMQNALDDNKKNLADVQEKIKTASESELPALKSQEQQAQIEVDKYTYAVNNNIDLRSTSYLAGALDQLYTYKPVVDQLSAVPDAALSDAMRSQLAQAKEYVASLENVLKNKDFTSYISVSNKIIHNNETLSDDLKKIQTEINDLRLKYDIKGEEKFGVTGSSYQEQLLMQIQNDKMSLATNIDQTSGIGTPLTAQKRDNITNDLAVSTYKLENKIGADGTGVTDIKSQAFPYLIQIGSLLLVILMFILAGSSVSQEMSTGSIKSLIIAPTRRWKIFAAKFLSILTVLILGGVFLYGVVNLVYGLYFGFHPGLPYIYASGGVAHSIPYYLYYFAFLFVGLIEVFVYMVFAFMLSIVTRNSAASVGISIGVYFGGSIIYSLLNSLTKFDWIKFLPFGNTSVAPLIFPFDPTLAGSKPNTTLTFALTYLVVMVVCMMYIGFDSFTRRDIK